MGSDTLSLVWQEFVGNPSSDAQQSQTQNRAGGRISALNEWRLSSASPQAARRQGCGTREQRRISAPEAGLTESCPRSWRRAAPWVYATFCYCSFIWTLSTCLAHWLPNDPNRLPKGLRSRRNWTAPPSRLPRPRSGSRRSVRRSRTKPAWATTTSAASSTRSSSVTTPTTATAAARVTCDSVASLKATGWNRKHARTTKSLTGWKLWPRLLFQQVTLTTRAWTKRALRSTSPAASLLLL